jgi:hypothetical protein
MMDIVSDFSLPRTRDLNVCEKEVNKKEEDLYAYHAPPIPPVYLR